MNTIVSYFTGMPPEWAVFLLSMFPIVELRGAIPLGIEVYKLSPAATWILAVLGNMVPALIILFLMPRIHEWVVNHKLFGKHATTFLNRAEKKFSGKFAKYGAIGLVLFVGIPLPMTGAWTGSLAAFVFNIPFRKSAPLIGAGVILAGIIVLALTLFAGKTVRHLFL